MDADAILGRLAASKSTDETLREDGALAVGDDSEEPAWPTPDHHSDEAREYDLALSEVILALDFDVDCGDVAWAMREIALCEAEGLITGEVKP